MKLIAALALSLLAQSMCAQEIQAPAPWKDLVGKSFKSEKEISLLSGFTQREGTMLSDPQDEEKKSAVVFRKDNTVVVLYEVEGVDHLLYIIDVIEMKNVTKTQEVKVATCRYGQNDDPYIVALVEQSKQERWRAVKAWHFNLDKLRIEKLQAVMVTCIGVEGED